MMHLNVTSLNARFLTGVTVYVGLMPALGCVNIGE